MQIRGFDKSGIEIKGNRDAVKIEIFVPGSRSYCNLPIDKAKKLQEELQKAISCALAYDKTETEAMSDESKNK